MKTFQKIHILLLLIFALSLLTSCDNTDKPATNVYSEFNTNVLTSLGMSPQKIDVVIDGLTSEYNFIWLSDLHIIVENDEISENDLETVRERINWSSNSQGMTAAKLWGELSDCLDSCNADLILFGGDMLDYCSSSNITALADGLDKLTTPYIYVRADHDLQPYYCDKITSEQSLMLHTQIDGNSEIILKEFPDICVVGINNSTTQITESAWERFKEIYSIGKPIILLIHVPLNSLLSEELEELSKKFWGNRALMWGQNCYYSPNETTQEFLNLIYAEDSLVKEVLSGHLHFAWDGYITNSVHEHIFDAVYTGQYGIISIKGK